MKDHDELERVISELLTEGEVQEQFKREEQQRKLNSPKYEVRIQTTMDPIVEETLKYRSIARELDDRYNGYMERAEQGATPPKEK
ncbi:hypothetical protein [Paenibacillus sp. IHBB 10380]|uniref:hypothetical protein n=1 Tax=Paenibacillus sp. IHBB 10380 TaxID=1566358 RepID=UPI0005CFB409|nr:hypothetical protein [Paenibacillus sp. IHBB 10380]AJS61304.1 hypothetical protein UB51_25915 [Paenibacillus sp. IHBB 10380]